jgi:iron complex transport system ATP-binding protein
MLNQDRGLTIIMASHDLNIASEYCDRLVMLQRGRIYKIGSPEEVITKEDIEKVYGCDVYVDKNPISLMPRVNLFRRGRQ